MAVARLPLLRGRITSVDSYIAPRQSRGKIAVLPSLDPKAHRSKLLSQLDAIVQEVNSRTEMARDELARREIIAIRPAPGARLAPEQLDDTGADARLVGVIAETGTVVLDVANADLEYLRKKLDAFTDDSRVKVKTHEDGSTTEHRKNEQAVAPLGSLSLAELGDIGGPQLRAEELVAERAYWFEIACRGGYRRPPSDADGSRLQIARQLVRVGAPQELDEFQGPEQIYFAVRLTRAQLDALRAATDCIYEVELAPQPLRDLKLLEDTSTKDVKTFVLGHPPADAPSVVVLDTGVATRHPLLQGAILSATCASPEIPSPEDTFGHGTKMAGIALYSDLGAAIERGRAEATHWLQSSRLLIEPNRGLGSDENYKWWPVLTERAVLAAEGADPRSRSRVFVLAVTRNMQDEPLDGFVPTLWSHTMDQLAFRDGGRLMIVSAGNARQEQWLALDEQHPQLQLSEKIHQPAQATNVLTVGAFTARVELPNSPDYAYARVVAKKPGGISPFTTAGLAGNEWPIKPDVMFEGGNLAISGPLPDDSVPTLCALTTSHRHAIGHPLGQLSMTSEASAHAARFAARVWLLEPKLRPETVRALIVHSASWTKTMIEQFPGVRDRLLACGYGVPDGRLATECAQGIATIVIEDTMPNAVAEEQPRMRATRLAATKATEPRLRRKVKLYRLPIPSELLSDSDPDVELRVTLSYFAEPNKFGRSTFHGLDLKWDMQGPQESEEEFVQRVNALKRPGGRGSKATKAKTKSFKWQIGIQSRSRGTVQSDRWRGKMSALAGDKLIAITPVLGWWDQRQTLKTLGMRFSLVVSVFGPGVYAAIRPRIETQVIV